MAARKKKQNLVYQPTKIHPVFKMLLQKDVRKKYFQSINHGINAMIYAGYKSRMSKKQREAVRSVFFGRTILKKSNKKGTPNTL